MFTVLLLVSLSQYAHYCDQVKIHTSIKDFCNFSIGGRRLLRSTLELCLRAFMFSQNVVFHLVTRKACLWGSRFADMGVSKMKSFFANLILCYKHNLIFLINRVKIFKHSKSRLAQFTNV